MDFAHFRLPAGLSLKISSITLFPPLCTDLFFWLTEWAAPPGLCQRHECRFRPRPFRAFHQDRRFYRPRDQLRRNVPRPRTWLFHPSTASFAPCSAIMRNCSGNRMSKQTATPTGPKGVSTTVMESPAVKTCDSLKEIPFLTSTSKR